MSKHYLSIFIFLLSMSEIALAKSIVDCRVATGRITECNPYGRKLHYVKKVIYDHDRLKLIIVKTLPTSEKKHFVKVISVAEMIEKYIKVEDSKRFTGNDSESVKITVVEVPLDKEIVDKKIEKMAPVVRNEAHRVIEECMLAANVSAANFLLKNTISNLMIQICN